jgi:DNA segregation ATPase FtsK/SpoIIIE-like protein
MAAKRKKRPLRPRVPARVKKRTKRQRSQHENELLGLALLALGLVLGAILYLGLDGGAVGSWLAGILTDVVGSATYVLPVALVVLGGLLLARSDLLEVRPFRLGVGVGFLGLMTLLGKDSGGWIGLALGGTLAALIGDTGAAIVGGALLLAGFLLVSGASTGAILRRTGHVLRRAGSDARRAFEWPSAESPTAEDHDVAPPARASAMDTSQRLLDGAEAYPDVVGASASSEHTVPAPLLAGSRTSRTPEAPSPCSTSRPSTPSTACPTARCCARRRPRLPPRPMRARRPPSSSSARSRSSEWRRA